MEDIYTIVDKAIDVAFEEQKFHLKYDLSEYIKGGKDGEHQILREAYGHLGKPNARKIRDYFNEILDDAKKYEKERRRGRRKTKTK